MKTHRTIRYRLHPGSRAKAHKLRDTAEACPACAACGDRDHADHDAALNLLAFGNGATGRGGGGVTRPVKRQTDSEPPVDFAT